MAQCALLQRSPGRKCRFTVGDRENGRIPVKSYREILRQYFYHPESKFGPDGRPCDPWTRGILRRRHITNWPPIYIGKESDKHWEEGGHLSLLEFKTIEYTRKG